MNNSVKVTVISVNEEDPCSAGLKPGDSFIIKDKGCMVLETEKDICPELFNSVFPGCMSLASGGELPWEDEEGRATVACPDPISRVVVRIERV